MAECVVLLGARCISRAVCSRTRRAAHREPHVRDALSLMPKPKHWDDAETPRRRSQRQEGRLAAEFGLRVTPNSGATPHAKSDALDDRIRAEMKLTSGARVPVGFGDLEKIWREAAETGRNPVVLVTFEGRDGPVPGDWALIEASFLNALLRGSR